MGHSNPNPKQACFVTESAKILDYKDFLCCKSGKFQLFCCHLLFPDFEEPEDPATRSFFSEIISSISDVKFSHNGRYLMTRDYLTVKVWDLQMENKPVETYQVCASPIFLFCRWRLPVIQRDLSANEVDEWHPGLRLNQNLLIWG